MIAKTRTFMLATLAAAIVSVPAHAVRHYDILMSGYYNGPSVSGTFGLANIFEMVPFGAVSAYNVETMPSSFIVDPHGMIRFSHSGFHPHDPETWRTEVDQLLR